MMKAYYSHDPEELKSIINAVDLEIGYPNSSADTYSYVFNEIVREVYFILIRPQDVATFFSAISGDIVDYISSETQFTPQIQSVFGNARKYICFGNDESSILGNIDTNPLGIGPEMTADFFNGLNYAYLGQGQNAFGVNERPVT